MATNPITENPLAKNPTTENPVIENPAEGNVELARFSPPFTQQRLA